MAFFREVLFYSLIRIILRQKARNYFIPGNKTQTLLQLLCTKLGSHLLLAINKENNRHTTPPQTHIAFIMPRTKGIGDLK